MKALRGDVILARDGDIGFVIDAYFDDRRWRVSHLAVDTGHVMPERRVLVEPSAIVLGQPTDDLIRVRLTRAEVERSPEMDSVLPVSRQFDQPRRRMISDPHLRSGEVVIGYRVEALDGRAGRLSDMMVDGRTWAIASLIVDTGRGLPGRRVVLSPASVAGIDWVLRKVSVDLSREAVRRSPQA